MRNHMVFLGFQQTAYDCDLPITILKWSWNVFLFEIMWSKNSEIINTNEINPNRTSPCKCYCYLIFSAITPINTKLKRVSYDLITMSSSTPIKVIPRESLVYPRPIFGDCRCPRYEEFKYEHQSVSYLKPFVPNEPLLYSLKTSENLTDVFKG